jgi:hypothetical protein
MTRTLPMPSLCMLLSVIAVFVAASSPSWAAKKAPPPAAKGPPPGVTLNACGCYRTEAGTCLCGDKKGKCECPGDCEPVGCDAKRAKEVEREIAAETKKAQEEEKKRQAAEAARAARENEVIDETAPAPGDADGEAARAGDKTAEKTETRKPKAKGAK